MYTIQSCVFPHYTTLTLSSPSLLPSLTQQVVEQHDLNPFLAVLGASTVSGVVSACVSTPVDVVKTRLMNQAGSNISSGAQYSGKGEHNTDAVGGV